MQYGRKTTHSEDEEGRIHIKTEGYHGGLNSIKEEVREVFITTRSTFLNDLIKTLDVFTMSDADDVTIELVKKNNEPRHIIRTHTIYKKKIK